MRVCVMMTDYEKWAKLEAEFSDDDEGRDELAEKVKHLGEASRGVSALRELRLAMDDELLGEDAPPLGAQYRGTSTTVPRQLDGEIKIRKDPELTEEGLDVDSSGILARAAKAVPSTPQPATLVSSSMPPPAPPTKAEIDAKAAQATALVKSKPLDSKRWDRLCDDELGKADAASPSKLAQLSDLSKSFDQMRKDRLERRTRYAKYYEEPDPAVVAAVKAMEAAGPKTRDVGC